MTNDELDDAFDKRAKNGDGSFAIALAILRLADAQMVQARAIQRLGNADASTHLGALEALGIQVEKIAQAISEHE
jgi:hypothetical protein